MASPLIRILAVTCAFLLAAGEAAANAPADCPARLTEKDPELEMVVNVLVVYRGCAQDVAGFEDRFGGDFRAWQAKYRDALARYERNAQARRYVECGLDHERRRSAKDDASARQEKAQVCNQSMGPRIKDFTTQGPR